MNKRDKIIFYVTTGLLTLMMLGSSSMYIFNHDFIAETFTKLGFPTYIIYPLAFLKISGLTVIWLNKWPRLTQWAYAGFTFNFILAAAAHIGIGDGEAGGALMAMVLLGVSYIFNTRREAKAKAQMA